MKKLIFITFLFFTTNNLFAQTPQLVWAKQFSGPSSYFYTSMGSATSVAVDTKGNVYTTGGVTGTVDFDPGPGIYYLNDIDPGGYNFGVMFISKLDSKGNFVWVKQIGTVGSIAPYSIAVDGDGNIYTTGEFNGTVDFDPDSGIYNLTDNARANIFISKLDSSGNFIWAKQFSSTSQNRSYSIAVDANENVYTTGWFTGPTDFDPGVDSFNLTVGPAPLGNIGDVFISKLDINGNFKWAKKLDGPASYSVAVDANQNVYTTGLFNVTSDFDPGPGIYNLDTSGCYILKLNSLGNFIWAERVTNAQGGTIALDAIGNVYTTGLFTGNADFDPGPGTYTLNDTIAWNDFILKLNATGNFIWAKQIFRSNSNNGTPATMTVDATGNVYTTGVFTDTADFDPGSGVYNLNTPNGVSSPFISKLDVSGNLLWAEQSNVVSNALTVDANNNVYIGGGFGSTTDFDPSPGIYNLTPVSGQAIFVAKFKEGPIVYTQPKLYTAKASLNVGESQTITGKDFTGEVNLFIKNSTGDLIPVNTIIYLPNGGFSYQLPIISSMPDGEYSVYATDITTKQTTAAVKFKVNNIVQQKLIITEPLTIGTYSVNNPVTIIWNDFISTTQAIGKSGFIQKRYKIEYSNNNGATWHTIESSHVVNTALCYQTNPFSIDHTFTTPGNYTIKVTDLDYTSDFNTSDFILNANTVNGFTTSLNWDHSLPDITDRPANPIGLAADGTARIFIKLKRDYGNTKPINEIDTKILPLLPNDNSTGTTQLGKIMYATNTDSYSAEANSASFTSVNTSFDVSNNTNGTYAFWLVAPDDFTQVQDNQDALRTIQVIFNIIYTDNTSVKDTIDVKIVRPPLMLVHGINADATTFLNTKYNIGTGGSIEYFSNQDYPNPLWINSYRRIQLDKAASYENNAMTILGMNQDISDPNTFHYQLYQMIKSKYACNRVDYVCHSMGGCVARYAINFLPNYYSPQNYNKGFINKLITINTPHNGSYLADWLYDKYYKNGIDNWTFNKIRKITPWIDGFIVPAGSKSGNPFYQISPAVKDLRAFQGGVQFPLTTVKNHLIGSEEDPNNINTKNETYLFTNEGKKGIELFGVYHILLGLHTSVNDYIFKNYANNEYLSNSDFVVPIMSQLNYSVFGASNIENNPFEKTTSSILYGNGFNLVNHMDITDDINIGNRVMSLLNSPINDGYFAANISASNNPLGLRPQNLSVEQTLSINDSDINYIDTNHIQIVNPGHLSTVYVDSTININLLITDTNNLQKIQLVFQGEYYESYSKISNQTFNIKIHSDAIGYNQIVIDGLYDSSGYTVYHRDTATLFVKSLDTLKGFYITPKTQNLNRNQTFKPIYNAVYSSYIGTLNDNIDSLSFSIADTNVAKYIDSIREFTTKDTGTTYIIFNYKGFIDTAFIYISIPENLTTKNICPNGDTLVIASNYDSSKSYQWEVNTGSGFTNISNTSVYFGTNTDTLIISNIPSSYYGNQYNCVISDSNGYNTSQSFTLKFQESWVGVSDSAWENATNWSCGVIPDENIDVFINAGTPFNPVINLPASCRSLTLSNSSSLRTNNSLLIAGKSFNN